MKSITIIIPTMNEQTNIVNAIKTLRQNATTNCRKQIIVVDGGSSDRTYEYALNCGVDCICIPNAPKGRGYLLNEGVKDAEGDVLMFLDADSIVPLGYDQLIHNVLKERNVIAGAFEFTLDGKQFGLRVVEVINRIRYRIWKRYYGDQGLFILTSAFLKVGGFPQTRLMESSDLCLKLAREGKLKLIQKPMLTSARRFLIYGIYRVLSFDIKMWWINLIGGDVDKYAEKYWKANERQSNSIV